MTIRRWRGMAAWLLALAMVGIPAREASAMITGGVGNKPLPDLGWPKGAASLVNAPGRVAWWEGPPFGGGQWHAEVRGDAKALNAALLEFAKVEAKTRRVVVHDGVGRSFWLNPNDEPAKAADARIDWTFMAWQPASWERLRKLPAGLNPTDPKDAETGPPSRIDVFAGGSIRWADVAVPAGLEVIDNRLEAHGFTPADGAVFEGKVADLATRAPIAARVRLQRVEPQSKGGYLYPIQAEASADATGRWSFTKTPAGWYRVIVEADGYAPRVAGYARPDGQPCWSSYDCEIAKGSALGGRVVDEGGKPLADVDVRLDDVSGAAGGRYESPDGYQFKTDVDGRFRSGPVPAGRANIWLHKAGYCRPGLGEPVGIPTRDVELTMKRSSAVRVTVDFGGKPRPSGYMVRIAPEGGEAIGSYGGAGDIDPDNRITYKDVPPGRYVLTGRPNPSTGDDQTAPVTVELKGGETAEVTLVAK
jgi:hypothetical protein